MIIDVYQGTNRKCLAIGNHRISFGKPYGFLEKVESYKCDTKYILSCIEAVNRWIPCSERLPDNCVAVLVYTGENNFKVWLAEYSKYMEVWTLAGNYIPIKKNAVTHWMPLPEPPAKE